MCAWQYVYGNHPVTEAYMGAAAVHDGADCLLIDAESEYEGKYVSAQTYIQRLRKLIGANYPLALAGFPYVDYHPAFPYSVFLGPGGAQYNAPQMYWKDIGVTTDSVFAHTYSYNLVYDRPIFPLGQVYSNPPTRQIIRFRELSRAYGAAGLSWWDWQEASATDWTALSRPAGTLPGYVPYKVMADLGSGAQGDMVVWAQEHLITAGYPISISGDFGYHTVLDGAGLPDRPRADRRRDHRPRHLGGAAALPTGHRHLGHAAARPGSGHRDRRRGPPPRLGPTRLRRPALGLTSGAARRDRGGRGRGAPGPPLTGVRRRHWGPRRTSTAAIEWVSGGGCRGLRRGRQTPTSCGRSRAIGS